MTNSVRATGVGVVAVVLWAALALLTTGTRGLPPFETLALSFAVAAVAGGVWLATRGRPALRRLLVPWPAWALGFAGLFLYHALYFIALAHAPAAEASLVAYLWPLLIVLGAALLPGGGLRAGHLAGAVLGLVGTGLLVWRPDATADASGGRALGLLAALGCAFVWSGYSLLNRRFAGQPSESLIGVCAAVAIAGLLVSRATEPWVWPSAAQAAALAGLGLGPVGLAFLAWDYATKRGRIALLGSLSYLAPLISALLLIAAGRAEPRLATLLAAGLIIAGAAVAARAG